MEPEIVLFGLILVNFGPLIIFPKMYPPISDDIQPKRNMKRIILKLRELDIKKNKTQNVNMKIIKNMFINI